MNLAKTRQILGYTERHHIVPKSLGGTDCKDNLVRLTAREHSLCHLMLVRMTEGTAKKKMAYAANATLKCRRFGQVKISTRMYEKAKADYADARRGVPRSETTKARLSKAHQGKKLSDEHRRSIGTGVSRRFEQHGCTAITRKKLREANLGKRLSDETREKISTTSKGRWWAAAKTWTLIDPTGNQIKVEDLVRFCHSMGLTHSAFTKRPNMTQIKKGKSKGWLVLERQ